MKRVGVLVIIGVGLIGGSFSLALRRAKKVDKVIGVVRTTSTGEEAQKRGVIDTFTTDIANAVAQADIVLLATPVRQMPEIFRVLAPALSPNSLLMDAGSTKERLIFEAKEALGSAFPNYVPAHPIAGRERSGVEAAVDNLYEGHKVIFTPVAETSPAHVARAKEVWQACGATIFTLTPARHDELFALISHLPHALAYALVWQIANHPRADELFSYSAGGFRDFTRIAASHPAMWRDIFLDNREALLASLDGFSATLSSLREAIAKGDGSALESMLTHARHARLSLTAPSSGEAHKA